MPINLFGKRCATYLGHVLTPGLKTSDDRVCGSVARAASGMRSSPSWKGSHKCRCLGKETDKVQVVHFNRLKVCDPATRFETVPTNLTGS